MFDSLSDRLSGVFDKLKGRGALNEKDVSDALREVRVALLEADVALPVARDFVAKVKERAVGQEVLRSVTPGQQVVKIVHDVLADTLGAADDAHELNLAKNPPAAILMVGLQGSGKTTTTAKLARRLTQKDKKKVLMASLDTRRPAAMEQLKVLGEQADVATLPIIEGQAPPQIALRAMEAGRLGGYDVVILDTAGRLSIDEQLMEEVVQIHGLSDPAETLLVLDSLTGQDAVQTAEKFKARVPVSGVVLTRLDGDGRGGAALSMRAVTGAPIKFAGMGEKIDALEVFDPARMAGRILGMGDIVSLVEKASEQIDQEAAEKAAKKLAKGGTVMMVEAGYKPLGVARIAREVTAAFGAADMGKAVEEVDVKDSAARAQLSVITDHPLILSKFRDPNDTNYHMANWPLPLISRRKPFRETVVPPHGRMASWPIGLTLPGKVRFGKFPFDLLVPGHKFMANFPFGHLIPGHKHQAGFPIGHLIPGHKFQAKFPFGHLFPGHKFQAKFPFGHLVPGGRRMANWPFPLLINGKQGANALVPGHKYMAKFPFAHLIPGHKYQAKFPFGHIVPGHRYQARFPFGHIVPGHKIMAKFPFGHIVPGHKYQAKFPFGHIVPGHKYMANWIFPHTKQKAS